MDFIVPFLVGLLLGAASICAALVRYIDIRKLVKEAEERVTDEAWKTLAFLAVAETTRLRVLLAEGEMAEDDKKVAHMTAGALKTFVTTEADALLTRLRTPVEEPACSSRDSER